MTLENTCAEPIELVWLTFDGDERPYTEIAPGGLYVRGSFEGHRWLLRGLKSGRELARFGARPDLELRACSESQDGAPASDAPREAVCSGTDGPPMVVSVESRCTEPLTLHWVNFQCQRKSYGVVNPNGHRLQPTFAGHAWLLVDAGGRTVSSHVADPADPRFIAECP